MHCSWAACDRPAAATVVGYLMCSPHVKMHHELERGSKRGGETAATRYRTPEIVNTVRELHGLGMTDGQIAMHVGRTKHTVRAIRQDLNLPSQIVRGQLRPHGTHAAFRRHKVHGEQPCDKCVEAERHYQRAYHQRRKEAS